MKLVSIDPGVERTGYAVFDRFNNMVTLKTWGCINTSKRQSRSVRFQQIYNSIFKLMKKYKSERMIIESIFFNTNQKTVVSIAQAQGMLMTAAANFGIEVEFLTPLQIKQALTGYGRADKQQVQKMVKLLLNLETTPKSDDAADAIACGLAYCSIKKLDELVL